MNDIFAFVDSIKCGTLGFTIEAITVPTMNKKGNPFYGRVTKYTRTTNLSLGREYEGRVENRATMPWTPESLPWGHWVPGYGNLIIENKGEYYLRVNYLANSHTDVEYMVDGRLATAEEREAINAWVRPSSQPQKQLAAGIAPTDLVIVRDYKVSNIISIKQGTNEYTKPFAYAEV